MPRQTEQYFLFVFRLFMGWVFFSTLSDELLNPRFVPTHVVPVLNKAVVFHPFFSMLATPTVAPVIGFLVMYGHLLIGLSLFVGLMVRASASFGIALMILYWLADLRLPNLHVVGHATVVVPLVLIYRIGMALGVTVLSIHILYSVILVYLILGRAGQVWGLDALAVKFPFWRTLRVSN
jgi:thiosulfate dehydrogenase (quinone) large subunit